MKKKIWIYVLVTLGLLGFLLLFVLGSFYFEQKMMPGLILFLVLLFAYGVFVLVRKLIGLHREKKFISNMLSEQKGKSEGGASGELAGRWKEAIDELRKSDLRHRGNPLYVLPWYMLIGESGSGKTTAIKNSHLSSNYASQQRVAGVAGTKNCDWWFFEQAIIIDTAGRYAIPQDEANDRDEWKEFLRHLSKYRKKEPLNGLVVTVAADRLLHASLEEMESDGRLIRERIEELMIQLGCRFPVYVMVTKCDLVQGMKEFCNRLPHVVHEQAFGFLNDDEGLDCRAVLKKAFEVLGKRIRLFGLRISNQAGRRGMNPKIVLFPEEFDRLQNGLISFFRGAFDETVYQEPPIIRGIYFTSAHQSGLPISHFVEDLGIPVKENKKAAKEGDSSFFLHDFFARILPMDRYSFSRTRRAMARRRKIGFVGGAVWISLVAAMCVLLSVSFYRDYRTIRQVKQAYGETPVISGTLLEDVEMLEHVSSVILRFKHLNEHQYVPRFGLNHCDRVERDLKREFCNLLKNEFLPKYDKRMADRVVGFKDENALEIAHAAVHYIQRINLISARLELGADDVLAHEPLPSFRYLVLPSGENALPSTLEVIMNQYLQYLQWVPTKELKNEKIELQKRLDYLVEKESLSLEWMLAWCNESLSASTIGYDAFWPNIGSMKCEARTVSPAFTAKGYEALEELKRQLLAALSSTLMAEQKLVQFERQYMRQYCEQWTAFCDGFPSGVQTLSEDELRAVMRLVGTSRGPYSALLERMEVELEPVLDAEVCPEWIERVYELGEVRELAFASEDGGDSLDAASRAIKKKPSFLKRLLRVKRALPQVTKKQSMLVATYKDYMEGVREISKRSATKRASLELASEAFSQDAAQGASPVLRTARSLKELQLSSEWFSEQNRILGKLVRGSFDVLWDGVCRQSSLTLQERWDEKVLADVSGIYDPNMLLDSMFGARGKAIAFVGGPAAPFIGRDRARGFYAKEVEGNKILFNAEFLQYLTRGTYSFMTESQEFDVMMEGVPTDVNSDALWMPSSTKLTVKCAEGDQSLENHNYPESHTFKWSPGSGGTVILQIYIEDIVLEKKYSGFRPFAQFVRDFSNGTRTFTPVDFPNHRESLERMGVEYIQVTYVIKGGKPVVELLDMEVGRVPEIIVSCLG